MWKLSILTQNVPQNDQETASKHHEAHERLQQQIVEVENSSFNPFVFATTDGVAQTVFKLMTSFAFKLGEKNERKEYMSGSRICPTE